MQKTYGPISAPSISSQGQPDKTVTERERIDICTNSQIRLRRFLVVDDHRIILDGIKLLLEKNIAHAQVDVARNGREAVNYALRFHPECVIMDQAMPQLTGIEATRCLRAARYTGRIVMLSSHREASVVSEAKSAGVNVYILKEYAFDRVVEAVSTDEPNWFFMDSSSVVTEGNTTSSIKLCEQLTKREREILTFLAEGDNVKTIAVRLGVSPKTVETHRLNLIKKVRTGNLASLTRLAIREGLIHV